VAAASSAGDTPPASAIPKGEVTKYTFGPSKIFPGTVRDYWVYVPKQYDPAKPACVYINQDGIQYNAPAVFDELIHKKEMPVTIGVFVRPGVVKALSPQALDRYNRSFEYDGLGPQYAEFLLEELLLDVEKKTTSDGRPIRLSRDGNDRCLAGASSGAAGSFTAAWERPDAFRRVFSAIGTYIGLRGANVYPILIRKVEPKPIRIFLQDGSNDANAFGGDFWMANQEMERALTFAGYEVNHAWGDGGHDGKHATQIFPDAMRWLWKDWPAPVKAGAGSPQLRDLLIPGEGWKLVGDGYRHTGGSAVNSDGEVFFVAIDKSYKIGLDGKISVLDADTSASAQAFGPDGRLYATTHKNKLLAYDAGGKKSVIAEGFDGTDLVVGHDGGLYVTLPESWHHSGARSKIWYVNPKGEKRIVESHLPSVSAVTLSPDQSLLYVADPQSQWVYSCQIQEGGSLANLQPYYHLHVSDNAGVSLAYGMRVDREGRLWVATEMGIQVCDQAGRVLCIIPTFRESACEICFGGKDLDTLYAFCTDKVYKRKVKVKGVLPFQAPFKPKAPQL
jgi:sugar lactone lactonase YvrE/enterochelin esterase-like enzyme